jgi:hypothetical protein
MVDISVRIQTQDLLCTSVECCRYTNSDKISAHFLLVTWREVILSAFAGLPPFGQLYQPRLIDDERGVVGGTSGKVF